MNNTKGAATVTLERLLGLYTEASPESLPEGASPRCINDDFVVGGLLPRPGKSSVYSFGGASFEDLASLAISTPGTFDPNEVAWSNPANAASNVPGTYAEAILNSSGGSAPGLDQSVTASGIGASLPYGPFAPKSANEIVLMATSANTATGISPNGSNLGVSGYMFKSTLTVNPTTYIATLNSSQSAALVAASFFGTVLGVTQSATAGAGLVINFANPVAASGATIVVGLSIFTIQSTPGAFTCTDDKGNVYRLIGQPSVVSGGNFGQAVMFVCQNPVGQPKTITVTKTSGGTIFASQISIAEVTGISSPPSAPQSQTLRASHFNFTIPADELILGVELEVSGHQTTTPADAIVTGHLFAGGVESPSSKALQLPVTDGQVTAGTSAELWGLTLSPMMVNDPAFGVDLLASAATLQVFDIYAVKLKVFTSAPASVDFNYLKTYEQTSGQINTLLLDDEGSIWQEDVINSPGVLNQIYKNVLLSANLSPSNYAAAAADSGTGGFPGPSLWVNPGGATRAPNATYATNNVNGGTGSTNLLLLTGYGFSLPAGASIFGVKVSLIGHFAFAQTGVPIPRLSIQLFGNSSLAGAAKSVNFNSPTDVTIDFGGESDAWGAALSSDFVNLADFGVIIGGVINAPSPHIPIATLGSFAIDSVLIQVFYTRTSGTLRKTSTFAQSNTVDDREFMAFSNLLNGTDIPRTYDGANFDRLSQVGPGAPPTASSTSSSVAIQSITQNPAVTQDNETTGLRAVLWSIGPGSTLSGNIITVYYSRVNFGRAAPDPNIVVGEGIEIQGLPFLNGNGSQPINGDYLVLSTGSGVPPNGNFSNPSWYFTVLAPSAQSGFQFHANGGIPGTSYQATLATMTTLAQVPDLEVGGQFGAAGTGGAPPAGYDGTWTVLDTPNAAQMQITSTVLSGNVATYGFNLITGTAPVVGEVISVTDTLNGNGIFNVFKKTISAVTAGSFSIQLQSPDIASAVEDGAAVIFGTIFKFDPVKIIGNKFGGTIVTVGLIASGIRKVCYSFLTRDGYMTQPSPILTFDVTSGAASLRIGSLLAGPNNVIARIVHLTAADGDNFYNIPVPVTVQTLTGPVVNSATWLNDNISDSLVLSFADGVLLGATAIDTSGNNLFETNELGAPLALIPYGARIFAIGEQNKIQNLLNYSFDGGVISLPLTSGAGSGPGQTYPAGWTPDAVFGFGGSVIASPIFGFAYSIAYTGGGTSGVLGMLTQPAFQDEFEVPIIFPSTTYSVRVTLAAQNGGGQVTGNIVVDLYSPGLGRALGTFSIDLSAITPEMSIETGPLLTGRLAPVPQDLIIRLYANNLSNNSQVSIDRIEPFPTEAPNLSGQVIASYQGNFEAFDRVEGVVNASVENQQPVKSGFVLRDTLYLVKSGSLMSTQDNKTTQPSQWAIPRMVSQLVGTTSIYGVDSGEEWALIAGEPGLFVFDGGEPIKLTEEIQSAWNQINWNYGHTLWVRNDIVNRRILVGAPMKARDKQGNFPIWLPEGTIPDDQNPTTPNVILMLNYKQLNTASALAGRPEVHVSSFGGKMISTDMSRKWSIWTIKSPCAAFIKRQDTTSPLFLGNSDATGKIYELIDGLLADDGVPFVQRWVSHGFPTAEQEQGLQLGPTRKTFEYLLAILGGIGELAVTVFPNSLDSPYAHDLLPHLTLPLSQNGDVELPVNETGNRLFLEFTSSALGAGFQISRIVLSMRAEPWAVVRGRND